MKRSLTDAIAHRPNHGTTQSCCTLGLHKKDCDPSPTLPGWDASPMLVTLQRVGSLCEQFPTTNIYTSGKRQEAQTVKVHSLMVTMKD